MSPKDHLHRFTFDQSPARGEIVQLSNSYKAVLEKHSYPLPVQQLLGEFLAAAALLSATLKFEGILTLQVKGDGPLSMLMAECRDQALLRAIATYEDKISADESIFGNAQLAITIEPNKGQSYQGIVAFEEGNLGQAIEGYFLRSEQLPTRIWLAADAQMQTSAGLLLQAMPETPDQPQLGESSEDWSRIEMLSETVTDAELLTVEPETLLFRLYHEENARLYPASELAFGCSCSRDRVANSLLTLGKEETAAALAASGDEIEVDCHFCHTKYAFTKRDITALFESHVH